MRDDRIVLDEVEVERSLLTTGVTSDQDLNYGGEGVIGPGSCLDFEVVSNAIEEALRIHEVGKEIETAEGRSVFGVNSSAILRLGLGLDAG